VKFALVFLCIALPVFAQTNSSLPAAPAVDENLAVMQHVEELRAICIQNRRMICGKIIKVLPDGIVVDSGYTNLMRAPLNQSWLIPASAAAERATNFVERSEADAVCLGPVFLTDLPRVPPGKTLHVFDFVILEGFPMGKYTYTSVGTVEHTVRKFSAKVTNAVRWMYGREIENQDKAMEGKPPI
jgi:hypothetical protein